MTPVLKTVNPATLNFAQAILKEAGIEHFVMDVNASVIDGSIGAVPRRLMVIDEDKEAALSALEAAGMGDEAFRG